MLLKRQGERPRKGRAHAPLARQLSASIDLACLLPSVTLFASWGPLPTLDKPPHQPARVTQLDIAPQPLIRCHCHLRSLLTAPMLT